MPASALLHFDFYRILFIGSTYPTVAVTGGDEVRMGAAHAVNDLATRMHQIKRGLIPNRTTVFASIQIHG
jgi:hypothetical protein